MMQLEIYSPSAETALEPIRWNYEELKAGLQEALAAYDGRVYTAEMIGAAKKDRAALNKLVGALKDKRRELKNRCLEPYLDFEQKANELIALVERQSAAIDVQVKDFDSRRAAEKEEQLRAYYDTNHSDMSLLIPYEQIHNPRWLNVTYDLKKICTEIDELAKRVQQDLKTVNALETPFLSQIRDKYLQTLSLGMAMAEKVRLEEAEQRMKAYERRRPEPVIDQEPVAAAPAEAIPEDPIHVVDFRVWATKEQLLLLKQFLKNNNIKYGKAD